MSKFFLKGDEQLHHGVELVAMWLDARDKDEIQEVFSGTKQEERELYAAETVLDMFAELFPEKQEQLYDGVGRMIGFDALVGTNDRHAENWAVILDGTTVRFSPIYDTARALFWNYPEEQLAEHVRRRGESAFVEWYADRSCPVISCRSVPDANYFDLIGHCVTDLASELGRPIRSVLRGFQRRRIQTLLTYTYGRLLSPLRRRLIYELLVYRYDRLCAISGVR